MRDSRKLLIGAGVASVILWVVPVFGLVTLPLIYLNTHLHELSHALAAVATGGSVATIEVYGSGSGVTLARGGMPVVYGSAGYVGAALFGAWMIASGGDARGARTMLRVLCALLGFGMVLWVRGDFVGVLSGVYWVAALWLMSARLMGVKAVFAAQFLGMQQCLMAAQSVWVLLRINAVPGIENDAKIVGDLTRLPPLVWALSWCAISLLAMGQAFRWAWHGAPSRGRG